MSLKYDPNSSDFKDVETLGHVINIIEDSVDLTDGQNFLVEYFHKKTSGKRLAKRSDLNPMEIVRYIPNVILFDLTYGEDGELDDVIFRLLGTEVASFYGDWSGKSIQSDDLQETYPESNIRLLKEISCILKSKKSITTVTKQYSKDRPFVTINTLKIPFSDDGAQINKLFMYFEKSAEI